MSNPDPGRNKLMSAAARTLVGQVLCIVMGSMSLPAGAYPAFLGPMLLVAMAQWLVLVPWLLLLAFFRRWWTMAGMALMGLALSGLAALVFAILPAV